MVVERKRGKEKMGYVLRSCLMYRKTETDIVAVGGVQVPVMGEEREYRRGGEEGTE